MQIIDKVISNTRPELIDDTSSNATVYIRSDIKEVKKVDPITNKEYVQFEYKETQYSRDEWHTMMYKNFNTDLTNIQLAIAELAEMILEKGDSNNG